MKAREFYLLKRFAFAFTAAIAFYYTIVRYVYNLTLSQPEHTSSSILDESAIPIQSSVLSLDFRNSFPDTIIHRPELLELPPETGYPLYTSLLDTISTWNPDNPDPPPAFLETIQHFNYSNIFYSISNFCMVFFCCVDKRGNLLDTQ